MNEEDKEKSLTKPTSSVPTSINLGPKTSIDLSWLTEEECKELLMDYTRGMLDITKKAHELEVDAADLSKAQEEGVQFMLMTQPIRVLGEKKVTGLECTQMMVTQSEFDDSWITVPIEDSQFAVECDRVIVAIGFDPNPSMMHTCAELRCVGKGRIWTDENHMTTLPGVFAAGEVVLGSSSPDKTIAHARKVVDVIDGLLNAPPDPSEILEGINNG